MSKPKICLTCSAGGHFEQLRLAMKSIPSSEYDIYWVTYPNKHLSKFLESVKYYTIHNATLKKWTWFVNSVESLWILLKERPDVIISSGAGVSFPTIYFGKKLFHCKVIFLCSAANVTKPSRVPYRAYPLSDLFLVQWPELQKIFPNSKYIGVL